MITALDCGPDARTVLSNPTALHASPIIAGSLTPDGLGFPISRLERSAVLGQLVRHQGQQYQGCSGTLVGDRVVISAGHCVVLNQEEWLNGQPPLVVPAGLLHYVSGDDVNHPDCLLSAQSVHLNPAALVDPRDGSIHHDEAITILSASASQSCPKAVPLTINRAPITMDLNGELVLEGGFGSLGRNHDFSPIRYWALLKVKAVNERYVTVTSTARGFPSFGDSGSGILRRFEDGSLRNLGVCSIGDGQEMSFARLDMEGAFYNLVIGPDDICGPVGPSGVCREGAAITCTSTLTGFASQDCQAQGLDCVVGSDGKASCACTCDALPYCQADCACDAQCPCTCNVTASCDEGCACDPDCFACGAVDARGVCEGDVLTTCTASEGFATTDCAARQERCVVGTDGVPACACTCDTEPSCQVDCLCDAQCPCACDVSFGCDAACACDPECSSAPPPAAESCSDSGRQPRDVRVAWQLAWVALVLGLGRRGSRRG